MQKVNSSNLRASSLLKFNSTVSAARALEPLFCINIFIILNEELVIFALRRLVDPLFGNGDYND